MRQDRVVSATSPSGRCVGSQTVASSSPVHSALGDDISRGNLLTLDCFPPFHHLSSLCLRRTADPAGKPEGSRAVRYHTAASVSVRRKHSSVPECSGLSAPGAGRGRVCVRETAMTARKSCSSTLFVFVLFCFHFI